MNQVCTQWTDTDTDETTMVMFTMDTSDYNIVTEMAHTLLKEEGADLLLSEVEWEITQ